MMEANRSASLDETQPTNTLDSQSTTEEWTETTTTKIEENCTEVEQFPDPDSETIEDEIEEIDTATITKETNEDEPKQE